MAIANLSSKGQLVIPASIRKALGLENNSRVRLTLSKDKTYLVLEPLPANPIETLTGIFKDYQGNLTDEILEERIKDDEKDAYIT